MTHFITVINDCQHGFVPGKPINTNLMELVVFANDAYADKCQIDILYKGRSGRLGFKCIYELEFCFVKRSCKYYEHMRQTSSSSEEPDQWFFALLDFDVGAFDFSTSPL